MNINEPLSDILSSFEPITLAEMDSVKLMDRTDTKYVFRSEQLPTILQSVLPDYRILEINGIRASRYETLYFDTQDFQLYLQHHRGKPSRYKIRSRKYVESDLNFFEIKFKNNKGRTIKDRIKLPSIDYSITGKSEQFLSEKTNFSANILVPKLWSNCSRITLVNRFSQERLTLDINLHFKDAVNNNEKHLSNIVIAEVKQAKFYASSFIKLMKQLTIREGSISKYCFGVVYLFDYVKKNSFKPKLLTINKINHATL